MNKYILNSLEEYNFSYEKNYGYATIDGYEVNLAYSPLGTGPVFFFSTYLSQEKKNDFVIKMSLEQSKLVKFDTFEYGVLMVVGAMTAKGIGNKITELLPKVIKTLEELEAPKADICPQTGETLDLENSKTVTIPGTLVKIKLSNQAITEINEAISQGNEEFDNAPNNYAKGFLGILIGGAAGVATTAVFALIGYITALSSLISILLGVFLYKKFGGKENKVMIIMSFITTIVMILGALIVMYVVVATRACANSGVALTGLKAFYYRMEQSEEFRRTFYLDLGLNALFILVTEGLSIKRLIESIKRPQKLA